MALSVKTSSESFPGCSIIIPTLNEEGQIPRLLNLLIDLYVASGYPAPIQILVSDGGSKDQTVDVVSQISTQSDFEIICLQAEPGRSIQMNRAADQARYPWLFFLHADSIPPPTFFTDLQQLQGKKHYAACYRLAFDYPHPLLQLYAWFTRFDVQAFRFGDQGLFVEKSIFDELGGFNENFIVMEDNDLILRLRRFWRNAPASYREERGGFRILKQTMTTSARRYLDNGIVKLQLVFAAIYLLHRCGIPHDELKRFYIQWISGRPVV